MTRIYNKSNSAAMTTSFTVSICSGGQCSSLKKTKPSGMTILFGSMTAAEEPPPPPPPPLSCLLSGSLLFYLLLPSLPWTMITKMKYKKKIYINN